MAALLKLHRIGGGRVPHLTNLSVHRHRAGRVQAHTPVEGQALVHRVYMLVRGIVSKGADRKFFGLLQEFPSCVGVHGRSLRSGIAFVDSHFPSLISIARLHCVSPAAAFPQ